jgi:hypothetical protein
MRWVCQDITKWHVWFTWYPVKIERNSLGHGKWVWLERVERICIPWGWGFTSTFYRSIGSGFEPDKDGNSEYWRHKEKHGCSEATPCVRCGDKGYLDDADLGAPATRCNCGAHCPKCKDRGFIVDGNHSELCDCSARPPRPPPPPPPPRKRGV